MIPYYLTLIQQTVDTGNNKEENFEHLEIALKGMLLINFALSLYIFTVTKYLEMIIIRKISYQIL